MRDSERYGKAAGILLDLGHTAEATTVLGVILRTVDRERARFVADLVGAVNRSYCLGTRRTDEIAADELRFSGCFWDDHMRWSDGVNATTFCETRAKSEGRAL